jgi:hypothetical protein
MMETDLKIAKRDTATIVEILSHLVERMPREQLLRLLVYWLRSG